MKIKLTKADMMKGQPVAPKWYKAEIVEFVIKTPKSGSDSLNYVPTFKLAELDGFEMDHTFNSQAIGNMGPFIAALQNKSLADVMKEMNSDSLEFDTDTCVGKKLQIRIKNEEYQGRLVNKVDGFLPYDAVVPF